MMIFPDDSGTVIRMLVSTLKPATRFHLMISLEAVLLPHTKNEATPSAGSHRRLSPKSITWCWVVLMQLPPVRRRGRC